MTRNSTPKTFVVARGLRSALLGQDVDRRAERERLQRADKPARRRNDLLPALELVQRNPHALKTPPVNVRAVKPSHVRELVNAISTLGFTDPLLIKPDGTIIDGVVRAEAARKLGLSSVPCLVVQVQSPEEEHMLRLGSNRLAEKGTWSIEGLQTVFRELVVTEAPIEITGFELSEVDGLLIEEPTVNEKGPVEPSAEGPVSRIGDVLRLGPHRVVCGSALDSTALSTVMAGATARIVFTDQPYNRRMYQIVKRGSHGEFAMASGEMSENEFLDFNDRWIACASACLVDGGLLGTFIDWRGLSSVTTAALSAGLNQVNLVIWSKSNAGMGSLYRSQHELLPLFQKGDEPVVNNVELGKKGRWRSNVWAYAGASSVGSDSRRGLKDHPTVKPVAMLSDAILDLSRRGEVVLDPFLGSGSTLIACHETGRVCCGVELDPKYVDVIARRFTAVTGEPARLEGTGETFEEFATRRRAEREPTLASAQPSDRPGRDRPARRAAAA